MKVKNTVELCYFMDSQQERQKAERKAKILQGDGYIREGHHEYSFLGRPKMTLFYEKQEEV